MTKLLVVDDEARLTALMKAHLEPRGFEVDIHNTCRQAFEAAKRTHPDLVVLDVMLGDGAGYQVSRQLRADPELYLTPILFMSTLGEDREVQYSFAQGGDDYLVKPFKLETLLEKIEVLRTFRAKMEQPEPLTGLVTLERMTREIDHRLLRGAEFGVAYLTIDHMEAYKSKHGRPKCEEVIRVAGELVKTTLKDHHVFESAASYVGGTHFLVVLPLDKAKTVCKELPYLFSKRVRDFYSRVDLEQFYTVASMKQGVYSGHPLMELRVCLTHTKRKKYQTAQEVVRDLRDIYKDAAKDDEEVVFAYKQGAKW